MILRYPCITARNNLFTTTEQSTLAKPAIINEDEQTMFRVKICGITTVEDAQWAAQSGADAIGLNFYPNSPRFITAETAQEIVRATPPEITKVALFVNASAVEICSIFDDLQLDMIQLHGDEPPEFLTLLGHRPVMRAFRVGSERLQPIRAYLDQCRKLGNMPATVLIDSLVQGEYGGTGQTADWNVAQAYLMELDVPPLVLAGGLTSENVAAAIQAVHPSAVDVASGVESAPGRKDRTAVASFVQNARAAFD